MTFLSPSFLLFFPVTALLYFLLPQRAKNPWLLAASWFFYLCSKPLFLTALLFVTISSYAAGRILARSRDRRVLALFLGADLLLLFLFKYVNFALSLVSRALGVLGISFASPSLTLILPVGLSFYLFQAMGYIIDVYRGRTGGSRTFWEHALFLAFFPHLVSGPIGRAEELLPQLREPHPFDYDKARRGLLRFLWGAFQKLVLADRLALLVNTVFASPETFGALQLMGAAAAFSFQIYCDFAGYTDMALGTALSMGFVLRENFRAPYLATTIADFWRRWHMSLTSWFRDYLYIPLGGSRRGTARKYLNVLIVFAFSGLWHGAGLAFLTWGLLNGVYQVVGSATAPVRDRAYALLGLKRSAPVCRAFQIAVCFLLSTVAWVFFNAGSVSNALVILGGMLHGPLWAHQSMGLDRWELLVALVGLAVLFAVDLAGQKRDLTRLWLAACRPVRWLVLWALLLGCLIFGIYGSGFDAQSFLYGFSF